MSRQTSKRSKAETESEEDSTPPPSKAKKLDGTPARKNKKLDESRDSIGSEESVIADIPIWDFNDFVHDLRKYGKDKLAKLKGTSSKDIAKIAKDIPQLEPYKEFCAQPNFNANFHALYAAAARKANISLDSVTYTMDQYLNDGATVEKLPDFPAHPKTPINSYISENRSEKSDLKEMAELRKQFAECSSEEKKPYYESFAKQMKSYTKKLNKFKERYSDVLRPSHIDHLNGLIKKAENVDTEPGKKKTSSRKVKKTAYDWWKDANPDMYAQHDDEKREKKLTKKWEALDEAEKKLFENIAAKNA